MPTPSVLRRGWVALVTRLLGLRIVQIFRADRPLAIAAGLCALVTLIPLFVTSFLPLVDMGSNIGAAGLLRETTFGHGIVAARYRVNWVPMPYWSGWAFMSLVSTVVGPFVAAKAIVAIGVLLLPLSVMRMLDALGRSPRLGLWAFLLAWDTNIYWGWVTFQIGLPAVIWLLARMIETKSWKGAAWLIPWSAFVALTHPHAVVLLGVAGGFLAIVRRPFWRSFGQSALAMSGLAVMLPWLIGVMLGPRNGGHVTFDSPTVAARVNELYHYTVDVLPTPGGQTLSALAFVLFLIGPAALAALRPSEAPRRVGAELALVLVLPAAALYFTLPFAINGAIEHWWTYPRFGTYILLGLLLLPVPDLRGYRALALTPGLVLVGALAVVRTQQFAAYHERTKPYLQIISAIKPNSSFLPLDFDFGWEGTREPTLGQLHGYAAAVRSVYDPHLFDNPQAPLLFRKRGQPPQVDWFHLRQSYSFEAQGRFYDYIVVHPIDQDPLGPYRGRGVEWMKDAGQWRLYRVQKDGGAAAATGDQQITARAGSLN